MFNFFRKKPEPFVGDIEAKITADELRECIIKAEGLRQKLEKSGYRVIIYGRASTFHQNHAHIYEFNLYNLVSVEKHLKETI